MFASGLHSVLRSVFGSEDPPGKVLEVKQDNYTDHLILLREDAMILYERRTTGESRKTQKSKYDIVFHRPCDKHFNEAYSLFRSGQRAEAEERFQSYKHKVPLFVDISKENCTLPFLQKLCDTLQEHPGWNLTHLVAHFGLTDLLKNDVISSSLNSFDATNGVSPLQVAIITQNLKSVQKLVEANSSVEHLDFEGNTVFHYAAETTKEIILALNEGKPKCLNSRNKLGLTPLHVACKADKRECVKALILAGADVNITASQAAAASLTAGPPGFVGEVMEYHTNTLYQEDMKHGGTPLHWSCSRIVIEALVSKGCNINAVNFDSRTALHVMVLRNRLECVVSLLSNNADFDLGDADGNTPLHLAVQNKNVAIVQCLAVFGADLNVLNNKGQSARHLLKTGEQQTKLLYILHAVGAKRCEEGMVGCTEGCRFGATYEGIPPPPILSSLSERQVLDEVLKSNFVSRKEGGVRVLSLDGGGIRGLVLVQVLLELELIIKCPIVYCFDWIAGTSTGGILALALASGKSLRECLCLYFRMKDHTFVGVRPYASEALETVLKDTFGTETVMSDIQSPKLLITGVLADRKPVDLHLFRNYQSPNSILGVEHQGTFEMPAPPDEQLLWHVGRATGAAPSYFRAFGQYLDGGLIANNPTLDALTEIHQYDLALKATGREGEVSEGVSVVVSLGTGMIPVKQLRGLDVYRPESIWDGAKLLMGMSALGNLLVDQATASDGRVVDRARAWCSMIGTKYYRFSPQLSEDIAMDEKSDEKLVNMLWECKAFMYERTDELKELAKHLLQSK